MVGGSGVNRSDKLRIALAEYLGWEPDFRFTDEGTLIDAECDKVPDLMVLLGQLFQEFFHIFPK